MNKEPEYLLTYQCKTCGQQSSFADTLKPHCRHCENSSGLEIVSKQKITAEVMNEQLKASMERMYKNLQMALESMTDEDKAAFKEGDGEKEMLLLLEKAKQLKAEIDKLHLKDLK